METTSSNIEKIWLTDDAVHIRTKKGRTATAFFADYPTLSRATSEQRNRYTISAFGIHWEEIDEDLSFEGFFRRKNTVTSRMAALTGKRTEPQRVDQL